MTATEDSVPNSVPMRPGRNGGQLRTGNPCGGGGRKKDELREALRGGLDAVLERIAAKLADPNVPLADLVRVAEFQARYGLGIQQESDVTVRRPSFTPGERAERVLSIVRTAEQRAQRGGKTAYENR